MTLGTTAVVHEIWNGRVWCARPMRVVEDSDDRLVLWFPHGTRWQAPVAPPSRAPETTRAERLSTSLVLGDWIFRESTWDVDTLQIWRPGEWHATWISWLPDGTRWGWYANIQRPFERTGCGVSTMDLVLDVTVELDGTWRLKDEDELDVFVRRGVFDGEFERTIRREAELVVARLGRREPPFDGEWDDWRPDPGWKPPRLPDDWATPCR